MPIPANFKSIAVASDNPYGLLAQQLTQIFTSMFIHVVPDPKDAPVTLRLFSEHSENHLLSQSASSATTQYTLSYDVMYQLQAPNGSIIYGPKKLHAFRNYMVNERQVLSSSTEQEILSADLQHDMVYQIVTQLSSPDVTKALAKLKVEPHEANN